MEKVLRRILLEILLKNEVAGFLLDSSKARGQAVLFLPLNLVVHDSYVRRGSRRRLSHAVHPSCVKRLARMSREGLLT